MLRCRTVSVVQLPFTFCCTYALVQTRCTHPAITIMGWCADVFFFTFVMFSSRLCSAALVGAALQCCGGVGVLPWCRDDVVRCRWRRRTRS